MDKIIVWGTGNVGSSKWCTRFLEKKYEIVAYCDNDKKYENLNGYRVIEVDEFKRLMCVKKNEREIDAVIVAVANREIYEDIVEQIKGIENDILCCWYMEICHELEKLYIEKTRNELSYDNYSVDYQDYLHKWVNNLISEVEFWVNYVAKETGEYHDDYIERMQNDNFIKNDTECVEYLLKYVKQLGNPKIADIGCGLTAKFGEKISEKEVIDITRIDPLAYFYNEINKKYAVGRMAEVKFGLFEFMAHYYKKNSFDVVIICNALDHCIDPYKSIIECLNVVKNGGMLYLNHYRSEGVNERYTGLHQWNIDYNDNEELIIWNYDMSINVSKELDDIVDVIIEHKEESEEKEQIFGCYLMKKRDFSLDEYISMDKEAIVLSELVNKLMMKMASVKMNKEFAVLLE